MKELTLRQACALMSEGRWREVQRVRRLNGAVSAYTNPLNESHVLGWLVSGDPSGQVTLRHNPPPPEPKRVPLGPEDVLHSTEFRTVPNANGCRYPHGPVAYNGVYLGGGFVAWNALMEEWERTDDSGRTWLPCWKEVQE
jgi:hypothetical protein